MLSRKIHEIRAIFDQNPTLVRNPTLPPQKRVLELEAKYGFYSEKGFNSTVPYIHYERLLTRLRELLGPESETIQESQVAQSGNIRRITTTNVGDVPETVVWQRKQRLHRDIELEEYDIRVSANVEEELFPSDIPTNFIPEVIRDRTRHSFMLNRLITAGLTEEELEARRLVRIDLTEVLMRGEDNVIRPRYEVEVEYLGTVQDLNEFSAQVEYVFKLLRGTNLIYTNAIKNQLIQDTVKILGGARTTMIDKSVLVEARNIKRRDLVYGGIVGNDKINDDKVLAAPRRPDGPRSGTNYMITFKADGLRKMLIIHSTGIWLVYPPFEFNLALNTTLNVPQLDRLLATFNGTVFDGELVVPREGVVKNIAYWYLVFDCLAFRGNAGIQRQPYTERQKIVTAIAGAIKTPILTIDTKDTEEIKSPDDFFRLVRQFLDKRDALEYDEDGLIFVPIDTHYNPMSQRYPLQDRSLTRIPDVGKWKEGADITIDFALRWLPGGLLELHVYDEETEETVPFHGDIINPLTPDMIDHTNEMTKDKPTKSVFEYEWVPLPTEGEEFRRRGMLRPRRPRPEKSGPNRLSIALDDWEDIMNPITEEDISGENLSMVFSYHNRIKRGLYGILTQNPDFNPRIKGSKRYIGANILDIGSGRGGDVSRWNRLTDRDNPTTTGFVVAVEPNDNNRTELVRRVEAFALQEKVSIIPTGGEDTVAITEAVRQHIPGGKVDAVTLMLSMSFLWASDAHLDALVRTIVTNLKPGGKVVFLTIDGEVIQQLFEPALGGPHVTDLTISEARLHLYPRFPQPHFGRPLDFILPDTIVGDQREYLVHLQDFTLRLAAHGINPYEMHRAEGEKLLSDDSALFSSMYSFGYYINDDKIALIQYEQAIRSPTNIILPVVPVPTKSPTIEMDPNLVSPPITTTRIPSPTPIPSPRLQVPLPSPQVLPPSPRSPGTMITPIIAPTVPVPQVNIPPLGLRLVPPLIPIPSVPTAKPNKFQIEHNQLRWLVVSYTGRGGAIVQGPARNDDTYAPLTCKWYRDLVRIATIGDGSCFIHAVLKAFYRTYQENNGARYRLQLAAKVRRDLAVALGLENPQYPGRTYWETSARGSFPRMVMQQINDEELIRDLNVDYSLAGLQRLFNSTSQLGDEVYTFVADALNIDIYVLRATREDLYPHYHTRRPGILRNGIVVIGNMYHYEVLAVNTPDGFQTVFPPDDPFLAALTELFVGDGDFNDIVNAVPYDPDNAFVADFVEAFTTAEGLNVPANITEIFPETDPFRIALTRLMPRIEEAARNRARYLATPDVAPQQLFGGDATKHPVLVRLSQILLIMRESGFSMEELTHIMDVVEHRLVPDIPQDLNSIVSAAETDGLLPHETVQAIVNVEATL